MKNFAKAAWTRYRDLPRWGQIVSALVAVTLVATPFAGKEEQKPVEPVGATEEQLPFATTTIRETTTTSTSTTTTSTSTTVAPTTAAPPPPPTTRATVRTTTPPPTAAPRTVYYANCTEARAAGAAPVRRGDPGYHHHLDRDGDGIGCE